MIMMSDMAIVKKDDLRTRTREWFSRFLCDNLGHSGPTIGKGRPIVTEKKNHPPLVFGANYWIRRCRRFRCGETFSNHDDLIA